MRARSSARLERRSYKTCIRRNISYASCRSKPEVSSSNLDGLIIMEKSTVQEEPMGCAIACVAHASNINYKNAKALFSNPDKSITKGYLCREIVNALKKASLSYKYVKFNKERESFLDKPGTMVFIEDKKYPQGHYIIRTSKGWMNPWINFPSINPAKSGFQKKISGKPKWIIYREI